MELVFQFLPNFLLVFCRITAFFVTSPIFSSRNVPSHFKVGIGFFVAFIAYFSLGEQTPIPMDETYFLLMIRETLIGLTIGFTAMLFFYAIQVAGSFIDLQMGFGISNIIDPMTGAHSPILGNFKNMLAILLFLSLNGHHQLLLAIMRSYEWMPLHNRFFIHMASGEISQFILHSVGQMFYLGFQMAAPLVAALFIVDVALGILAKTVPQFNIFVVGIPIKIVVGFALILILIPGFIVLFQQLFATMLNAVQDLLRLGHR